MSLFESLVPALLLASSPSSYEQCDPIPGWDQVLAEDARWIVIGEVHGSNETPDIFADAVCLTAQAGPVIVAVEQPAFDQPAIDTFIASDGGPDARREFLSSRMWNLPKDGRSSIAYFRLFDALRRMHAAGLVNSVVAFQPTAFTKRPTPAEYEAAMADLVMSAAEPGTRVVALVGNLHAMRTEIRFQSSYLPMAAHLPAELTITLNATGNGGETWSCSSPDRCGATSASNVGQVRSRGVDLSKDEGFPFSGVLYLGTATTSSPPANSAEIPQG